MTVQYRIRYTSAGNRIRPPAAQEEGKRTHLCEHEFKSSVVVSMPFRRDRSDPRVL